MSKKFPFLPIHTNHLVRFEKFSTFWRHSFQKFPFSAINIKTKTWVTDFQKFPRLKAFSKVLVGVFECCCVDNGRKHKIQMKTH